MTATRSKLMRALPWMVLGGIVLWVVIGLLTAPPPGRVPEAQPDRSSLIAACQRSVDSAKIAANVVVADRSQQFVTFVEQSKAGARPFSEEVVSLYGKWRAVESYLPFTDENGHRQYIEEQFGKHLFSKELLATEFETIVTASLHDIDALENQIARDCQEVVDFNQGVPSTAPAATEAMKSGTGPVVTASQDDAAKAAGSLVTSEFVSQVVTKVVVKIGVSAGALSTGAAASPWTLGASLVIGLVVDALWEWFDDPAGDIERATLAALDDVARKGSESLRNELGAIVRDRTTYWDHVVESLRP